MTYTMQLMKLQIAIADVIDNNNSNQAIMVHDNHI